MRSVTTENAKKCGNFFLIPDPQIPRSGFSPKKKTLRVISFPLMSDQNSGILIIFFRQMSTPYIFLANHRGFFPIFPPAKKYYFFLSTFRSFILSSKKFRPGMRQWGSPRQEERSAASRAIDAGSDPNGFRAEWEKNIGRVLRKL